MQLLASGGMCAWLWDLQRFQKICFPWCTYTLLELIKCVLLDAYKAYVIILLSNVKQDEIMLASVVFCRWQIGIHLT